MTHTNIDNILEPLYSEHLSTRGHPPSDMAKLASYSPAQKRMLIDQLLCVRDPNHLGRLNPIVSVGMDELLRDEARRNRDELVPLGALPFHPADPASDASHSVAFFRGDLTALASPYLAIVNPANTRMLGCFQPNHQCLDNVIHAKAGPSLRLACHGILEGRGIEAVETSEPIITGAGALQCGAVVHVAGPALETRRPPLEHETELLHATYVRSLDLAAENERISTVAFPCISTGVFAFPTDAAARVAVQAVSDWFAGHPERAMRVVFVLWTPADEAAYTAATAQVLSHLSQPLTIYRPPVVPRGVQHWIDDARSIIIHAGAGLSADAVQSDLGLGLDYTSKELFKTLYPGLVKRTHLRRLYDTIGAEFPDDLTKWGFLFAHADAVLHWGETTVYADLLALAKSKRSYTVMTSNADQLFYQSGFEADRILTPQGNYATYQCLATCTPDSYFDARPYIERAMTHIDKHNPRVPAELAEQLIPRCEKCGGAVFPNLRGGDWFLETPYISARERYVVQIEEMIADARANDGTVLVLELGCGFNTPSVVRYPSERLVSQYPDVLRVVRVNVAHPEMHLGLDREVAVGVRASAGDFLKEAKPRVVDPRA